MFLMEPEFSLHQHARFLLHGVASGYDLETFAVHFADFGGFLTITIVMPIPISIAVSPSRSLGVKNR
jgi:hypothetical protein